MEYDLSYLVTAIALALAPSLVWIFFYLKEDLHPEPKYWLIIIFLMGVTSAPLVIFLETLLIKFTDNDSISLLLGSGGLLLFLVAPLVEEVTKYGIVHLTLNKNPVLDEPADGMIYMIVSALGFAAIENVIAIFGNLPPTIPNVFGETINFMSLRFVSAVALHGFASAIVGYFFALYYFKRKNVWLIFLGLIFAITLHGVYNSLIIRLDEPRLLAAVGVILGGVGVLVLYLFNRLKYHTEYSAVDVENNP
ncbi:hypothetical protein A2833_02090 [Candidatus Azambacteria bacterium RIFCSPHIGHO2_01_FULL_44_55]|uniref:Protease PrsW n=1 Tax=Candidatus Azambacteria bacterium RIFCSPLOWO2_02_FULL_44_14 TaxID=1797306 RepID=A0A1F5CCL6_9BACT|nr:MAG: hypothetical protein A3A18_00120 [Candidatus Azambacteria bacterium RIFCSPLOWO2_01_FULL_44_84]OGD32949.1 MAG: hypothetical protein A3C78_00245 [Candidatus Azambacteria bacterium RIFCSPHIGHO2_02_FULL_45_18]OGD40393.1 MAG: hypothetical protein A2833_02090 [Candidatus Azambacteria bacterium RIFCSPHIGHO2_01_FULL_44_55]OGD40605.1 MAG: hypothetical protein A3I30_01110 [Candidatus Azambacteria bacterium RIFCSPLOWO2_02_FULL_44_14]OGD51868.1 MAG: hypothetical protein A2608_03040 [Candidatus Azam